MNLFSKRATKLVAVSAVALAATACGSNLSADSATGTTGSSDGPVTLGVLVDQTAYLKTVDGGVLDGIKSAVDAVNADGGVLGGRKLQISVADTAADPQREVQAYQRVAGQDDPVVFLNGFSSAGNAAAAPIASTDKRPMIVASVVPTDDFDWTFSTILPMKYETGTRVEYLQDQGIDKVAILHDPTPYNKLQLDTIEGQLKEAGIEVTGVAEHASDAVDLRSEVSKLLRDKPGALLKLSTGPTQIVAAKALADAGSDIPLLLGIEAHENLVQATAAHDQTYVVAPQLQVFDALDPSDRTESATNFMEANKGVEDPTYLGRGWDAVQIAVRAIEAAGSTDGQAIHDALVEMDAYDGTSGTYDYTAEDHYGVTENPAYLAHISSEGEEIVFTPAR
jgi:branched-chain amino acid transport system substrate-binding protein